MRKAFRSILSLMLAVIVVVGVMAPVAYAETTLIIKTHEGYSDMWLVDANSKKTASTFNLYGRADYICLKMYQDGDNRGWDEFCFAMYSDSNYKKRVAYYSTKSSVGTDYLTIPMAFDDLKSGTYYVKTYVNKWEIGDVFHSRYRTTDQQTVRKYKVEITKSGTDIDEMNTVMYGYENTEKGPKVYWYSVPGATGYYLYRKNPKTGKYSKIKTVKDSGDKFTSYTDTTYKGKNVTRYYKVVAYKGSLKTPQSLVSLKVKAYKAPTVKVETISDNRIKISWSKVASGAKYTVFSRHNDSDKWKEVKTTSSRSYVLDASKYENNEKYRFTVIAKVNGVASGYNTKGVALHYLEHPQLKACTYPEDGGITVNWKSVSGADSYIIYRKNSKKDDWQELCTVKGGSKNKYTDLTANNEDYYYYTVRSVRKGVNGSLDNDGVPATVLTPPVLKGFTELDGQSIRINWEKLPNKCEYEVLRKTTAGWKKVATTSNNYYDYNFNSKIADETFTVKAVRGAFESDFDKNGVSYSSYPKVVFSDMVVTKDGASLQWKKPTNAENSVIYKKIGDGEYTVLTEVSDNVFVDTSVEPGVNYTYKIAYKYKGEVIEGAAIEQPLCVNTDKVERDTAAYNTVLLYAGPYKYFTTKIKDYDSESQYKIYHFTENGWVKLDSKPNADGEIKVGSDFFSNAEKFTIVKITPAGECTYLDEPDFTVEFVSDYIPETLASASVENGYPTISWDYDSTKTADKIHIYRKAPDSKNKYKLIGVVPATQTTFVDESANANYVYDYQLRVEKDGFVTYGGPVAQVNYMSAPEIKLENDKGRVHIEWNQISRAEKYTVYKKLPADENWTKLTTTSKTYFDDKNEVKYVGYQYRVIATDKNGNKSPDGVSEVWKYVPSVADFKAEYSSQKTKLTWKPVSGASGYVIRYYDYSVAKRNWSSHKVLVKIKGGSKSSYTDKTIPANVVRTYYVSAYYEDFEGVESSRKDAGYLSVQPKITSLKSTNNGVVIKIGKVSHIDQFIVYRKAPGDKKWKKVGYAYSDRTFKDYSVKEGKKYAYTVKSKFDNTGYAIYSTYNETGWSITYNP